MSGNKGFDTDLWTQVLGFLQRLKLRIARV